MAVINLLGDSFDLSSVMFISKVHHNEHYSWFFVEFDFRSRHEFRINKSDVNIKEVNVKEEVERIRKEFYDIWVKNKEADDFYLEIKTKN